MEGAEWDAHVHVIVHSWSGAKETAISGGGVEGGQLQGFSAYGCPLERVTSFKHLGRVISATDDDWSAVVRNLAREKKVWSRVLLILRSEGAAPWVSGFFLRP